MNLYYLSISKSKNILKQFLNILFIICFSTLLSCGDSEKYTPEIENYHHTTIINDSLFIEHYNDGYSTEVYLTDSLSYRLYILSYIFEYYNSYMYKINDKKIVFYHDDLSKPNTKLKFAKEYTFKELKKKNNLRR